MDPFTMGALGLGGQVLSGVLGELLAGKDEWEQKQILEGIKARFGNLSVPELEKAVANELGPAEAGQADPGLLSAQMSALDRLKGISDSGGMMLEDRANLNTVQNQLARRDAAGRSAIRDNMQQRGVGGSGAELAMQLDQAQSSAARAGEQGLNIAGMAQKRALDAMLARGRMAGDMRGQDFRERQARDEISRYNAGAKDRAAQYNTENAKWAHGAKVGLLDRETNADEALAGLAGGRGKLKRNQAAGYGKAAYSLFNPDEE